MSNGGGDSGLADAVITAPLCRQFPSDGAPRLPETITRVVIHTIIGKYEHAIAVWRSGKDQGCYKPHYAVRGDGGHVTQVMPELRTSVHANGENPNSIGIEHDGRPDDPRFYTEAMYLRSAQLTRNICDRYKIKLDRTGIIGHDEARRTDHFDPGGYWDWDYYIALVNWNGDAATRPLRVIGANDGVSAPWRTGRAWREVPRAPFPVNREVPHQHHAWSPRWLRADPLPFGSPDSDPAAMVMSAPSGGTWEVSLWWPALRTNNLSAAVTVSSGVDKSIEFTRRLDLTAHYGRSRDTHLKDSPLWFSLGTVTLAGPGPVWLDVSRVSPLPGHIAVDAVRLFKA